MLSTKIVYWISTIMVSAMMIFSSYSYFYNPIEAKSFAHLGFPTYFRIELAVVKLIGVILLLAPITGRIKEWTYAGFSYIFISAIIAHAMTDVPGSFHLLPILFSILLLVSYITYRHYNISRTVRSGI